MKELKIYISIIILLKVWFIGNGQSTIYLHDFGTTSISTHPYTVAPNTFNANLSSSSWSNSNAAWTSFAGSSGQAIALSNSGGTPTITLTFNIASGYQVSINQFNFWRQRSASGAQNWAMTINGISVGSGTVPTTGASIGITNVLNSVTNQTNSITVIISLSGASGTGTFRLDDFQLIGSVESISMGTSTIHAGGMVEPSTLSSLTNTQGTASLNFDIDITDDGATPGTDMLDTKITQMVFTQGTGNDVSTWTDVIAGAELSDGTNSMTGTINATDITFSGIDPAVLGLVSDDALKNYTLKVWLKTDMGSEKTTVDGKNVVFRIQNSNIIVDNSGSAFASGQDQNSGENNNAIEVIATALAFVQNASNTARNASMSPSPTISANDANGNRDLDYSTTLSMTSTGSLQGSPVQVSPTDGFASFSNIIHTVSETGRQLTVSSSGLSNALSNLFDIFDASSATDYFRSNGTDNWTTPGVWESSSDGMDPWITATLSPTSSANNIYIRNGNTITINSSITIDQTTIESGGVLLHSGGTLTINNGTGNDITIQNGGILSMPISSTYPTLNAGATINIQGSGILTVGAGSIIQHLQSTGYIYDHQSILEYTSNNAFSSSGVTYFPNVNSSTIPIFRISGVLSNVGGSGATVINGILEVESGSSVSWTGAGTKTFRNGITGDGTINQSTAGQIIISGNATSIACGTLTLGSNGLLIASTSGITLESNETINGGAITVATGGILDCGNNSIGGSTSFFLSSGATLITAHASGVSGSIAVSGSLTFTGGANYEIQGAITGFISSSGNNLTINNGAGVTMSNNFTVNGTLTFTNGKLFLEDKTLTIGEAGSISGATNSNYIVTNSTGRLKRSNIQATVKDFPIGSVNYYAPVSIGNNGAGDNFSAAFSESAPTCFNSTQQEESVTGTWDISEDVAGGSDCSLSVDFGSVPAGSGFVVGDAAIAHCNGATIDHVSVTNVAGTIVSGTGFTSFSPFGVGNEAALPIELISFIVRPFQNKSIISWQTASETNNSHFSIEKSADGKSFREIAQMPGHGTSYETHHYEYTDESPYPGLNYYRFKQVDFDGRYSYSPVVSVEFQSKGKMGIYPNPFGDKITLAFSEETALDRQASLFDQTGRLLQTMEISADELERELKMESLLPGAYILKVQSGQNVEMHRLVKL